MIPLWAYSTGAVAARGRRVPDRGLAVQGAWGTFRPTSTSSHPPAMRAMFPGFVYQLGNLFASRVSPFQAGIAADRGGD